MKRLDTGLIDISSMPGYVSGDQGRGYGLMVVRKWTDEDYQRLIHQEQKEAARLKAVDHEPMGETIFREAMKRLRVLGVKPYGMAWGTNSFMRATGNNALWHRLTGIATLPTLYDNTNARIGVGDSTTAVAVTQTDLQAASNKIRKVMVASYPQINSSPNDNQVVFRADLITGEAEFVWNEFGTFNAASGTDMFNRGLFSPSPGTKGVGVTWTGTETLTNV